MTDNDIDIAKLARKWAADCQGEGKLPAYGIAAQAAAEYILATTTEPTMADVDWDDEKHRGAGATDTNGKLWIMSQNDGDYINCIGLDMVTCGAHASDLTPNGKRYELREVTNTPDIPDEPEHTAILITEDDYASAPEGTIVDVNDCVARRGMYGWRISGAKSRFTSYEMAQLGEGDVIRWGGWDKYEDTSEPTVSPSENVGPDQEEHPATLETQADYENAPVGTVVAELGGWARTKGFCGDWTEGTNWLTDREMADKERTVLRRGWGK